MADNAKTAGLLTELGEEDLYGFIGVQPDGTEKEVSKHVMSHYVHVACVAQFSSKSDHW